MKKAYVNATDKESYNSDYLVKIEYENGKNLNETVSNYSYSNVFEKIKEIHEDERDSAVKRISIEHIR